MRPPTVQVLPRPRRPIHWVAIVVAAVAALPHVTCAESGAWLGRVVSFRGSPAVGWLVTLFPVPAWFLHPAALTALSLTHSIAGPALVGLVALRDLPSTLASVLALVEPLVAAVLAWLLLGQALDLTQLAGVALMLTGAVRCWCRCRYRSEPRPGANGSGAFA